MNLTIEPNSSVAFVGESGCGKSTLVGLLERFYNPTAGKILIDGEDIGELNIQWLRSNVALVAQQPVRTCLNAGPLSRPFCQEQP
jgi:ABC-type multidrug transport system fused ATPase/permease subunit